MLTDEVREALIAYNKRSREEKKRLGIDYAMFSEACCDSNGRYVFIRNGSQCLAKWNIHKKKFVDYLQGE